MFIENKYYRWYFQLIENARDRPTLKGYMERHHITPRCLGGSDDLENLVYLTFKEHFLAHWLLTKFMEGQVKHKLLQAIWRMCCGTTKQGRKVASWQYARARLAVYESQIGKPRSIEYREKIARTLTGKKLGPFSEEHKRRISESNKGKRRTNEQIQNIRLSQILRTDDNKGWEHINSTRKRCPYCDLEVAPGMYARWHGERCKNTSPSVAIHAILGFST